MLMLGSGLVLVLVINPGGICRASHSSARCDWYRGLTSFFRKVGAQSYLLPGLDRFLFGIDALVISLGQGGREGLDRR